jgi:hypothetical protein
MRRAVVTACWTIVLGALAAPAAAQLPLAPAAAAAPGFLSSAEFYVEASAIGDDDVQYRWDARLGAAVDFVDYGSGRLSGMAEYHPVLGNDLQPFDPNQAYYTFDVSGSYRLRRTELSASLRHVSRHLGDRPKAFGVDWNTLGARIGQRMDNGRLDLSARASVGRVFKSSFVDYEWMLGGEMMTRYPNDRRMSVVAGGRAEVILTDEVRGGRSHVTGGLAHVGLRLEGPAAALELFAAVERRVDPSPLTRGTRQWALAGFRVLSR